MLNLRLRSEGGDDTDVDVFALETDAAEARLPGVQCCRGGCCSDDEDECRANESVLTQDAVRRESCSAAVEQSSVLSSDLVHKPRGGVRALVGG